MTFILIRVLHWDFFYTNSFEFIQKFSLKLLITFFFSRLLWSALAGWILFFLNFLSNPLGCSNFGMGYKKSFGVLSRYSREKTWTATSVHCQRSCQRGSTKVSFKIFPILLFLSYEKKKIEKNFFISSFQLITRTCHNLVFSHPLNISFLYLSALFE